MMINKIDFESEKQRLKELTEYEILDTPSEQDFDELTKLASSICQVPVSLISFLDKNRQWFKSNFGTKIKETLREESFCTYAIQNKEDVLIINNVKTDERYKNSDVAIKNKEINFYAGIPLVSSNGFVIGTLCVIDTKPRQLEFHQIEGLKTLANQIIKLLELRKMNKKLEASQSELIKKNQALDKFKYTVSHDLKEPIRMIGSFMQFLKNKNYPFIDDTGNLYINSAIKGTEIMTALIDDLMQYTTVSDQEIVIEMVDMNLIVQDIISLFQPIIKKSNAIILVEPLPVINAEKIAMTQLMQNLIGNALKYKNKLGPQITISVSESDKNYVFCVADNGIGIDKKNNEVIFEVFKRLHSKSEYEGTGLGLAICKKIIDNLHGEIWVESELKKGSKFFFILPK